MKYSSQSFSFYACANPDLISSNLEIAKTRIPRICFSIYSIENRGGCILALHNSIIFKNSLTARSSSICWYSLGYNSGYSPSLKIEINMISVAFINIYITSSLIFKISVKWNPIIDYNLSILTKSHNGRSDLSKNEMILVFSKSEASLHLRLKYSSTYF